MKLGLVTSNRHKLEEYRHGLSLLGIEVEHLDADCDEIQADTLQEVVLACIRQLREAGHRNFMLDDSGLFVPSLNGFPGVYSAYVMQTIGCQGMLRLLEGLDRRARFECCIGVCSDELGDFTVTGMAPGRIVHEERGSGGFGYDPIFAPEGQELTFAEMGMAEKNERSHRGKAMALLAAELRRRMEGGA
ncbi:MAG TPA: RdgB/HAM1 family non-canonical purine NTP pyrophosphatase [Methanomassiliicoccales archaeon]|jgi:XTP/dITP diphosphohydrolase|nr:RdgB/HAM1 family non-canonical purine NTP pyrophosphatase [Methanomassiliicoccales archaeon]HPD08860.1 RdgB/HAM1 family non-canonical purine NTP pyrophosphatase [Methanomassiliicoccales archaeon]HQM66357.1 RdgB/HAM1 family non-canonical purine NTP pyrophosphatase [Methanomassiliicoccales archaeon]HRR66276.1 RdgB/HAM1 family non-canonical purine NTP pyrophosphatase [Methanomassiliicoccales archaeon]